ncbi:MAG TPA: TonB-dependent receptor, partial [Candidatus Saccharimonadales bacterium]|nr:TonB-dependent receptor [Candidatus Saccharimonadales bacterium]
IDHSVSSSLVLFGRYNIAPSKTTQRVNSLSNVSDVSFKTMTLTLGATQTFSARVVNELRLNYSRSDAAGRAFLDTFGGAIVPPDSILFPPFTSAAVGALFYQISAAGTSGIYSVGRNAENAQRQVNVVDNLSSVTGNHQLKFGVDYRYLSPIAQPREYFQQVSFSSIGITAPGVAPPVGSVLSGGINNANIFAADPVALRFDNFSAYGQDTWKPTTRMTLTYGIRWEVNPPPTGKNLDALFSAVGIDSPSTFALAPPGTPFWNTTYNNFAPRIGAAYQLRQQQGRETVLRGGFGTFYDLGQGLAASAATSFPYFRRKPIARGTPFPFTLSQATPIPFSLTSTSGITAVAFDPDLKLPRTYQWNATVEQSLGSTETISASYVGAAGRRLLRRELVITPNSAFVSVGVTRNVATSDYHALQLQFERRLSRAVQALVSYTWSKSLDIASNDSADGAPALRLPPENDRGPSDFDIRHVFSGAVTYNIPFSKTGSLGYAILRNWSIDAILRAQSARPITATYSRDIGFGFLSFRPDLLTDVSPYIFEDNAPGGKRLNRAAFVIPTAARQGTLGRNSLRSFPVSQLDLAVRRQFNLADRVNFQLRAEFFNIFNHPNFADPVTSLDNVAQFGQSIQMLGTSLGSGGAQGGFSPLYQIGGPRSIQLALRLQF